MDSPPIDRKIAYIRSRLNNQFYIDVPIKDEGLQALKEYWEKFRFRSNIDREFYQPRAIQRYRILERHFLSFLDGKVLDVGSRHNTIQEILKRNCQLVDKNNPKLESFDWEKEPLPYPDRSFDAVVCMDTLEHINDLHRAFQDLLRVSGRYVIISLPNCWKKTFMTFLKGGGGATSYGIPVVRPFDRHKWFFNPEDMEDFIAYQCSVSPTPYEVIGVVFHIPRTRWWHDATRALSYLFPERYYKNLFTETTFMLLKRRDG